MKIKRLSTLQNDYRSQMDTLLAWEGVSDDQVNLTVRDILKNIRLRGDEALIEYTNKFDRVTVSSMKELTFSKEQLDAALNNIPTEQRQALETAAERVRSYHEHQIMKSWSYTEADGTLLGQQITALDRVGLYVPGGKATYPSSVLMNAIPAKVAGVEEIVMVVPTPDGVVSDMVLAAAKIAGVDTVFAVGGAQAVAALAYGTETIPAVDKIVGPGNIYVATAKSMVFGRVGIDMIAGPSEIAIVADGGHPEWMAADFLSQAEHDEAAQSIFVSTDPDLIDAVDAAIEKHLETLPRAEIARASAETHGALIHVQSLEEAADVINTIAPEHLELAMDDPDAILPMIRHAGAIFLGHFVPEALGDFIAGPNHVLPTNRTARFSSPLGVYDFQKKSSVIRATRQAVRTVGPAAAHLAHREGLQAHALTIELRLADQDKDAS
ncbi:MAG: histidinol dehydrogenase [Gammaproteobacteria bacterium]|nr:histidinol dehydrogenase [Gammaproteobacteria bacterium]